MSIPRGPEMALHNILDFRGAFTRLVIFILQVLSYHNLHLLGLALLESF
jgi:hypothetical protein